ncbi:cupin-like domain-containing protein [Paraburkholderia adhaesiva]|uniref:cupin-like domain-containing protein n=1 Tax=Paraburkholderia adhaesiva TaxID=2883244 RepID=UPI001F2778C0|nr:cupin-like domain-containing protein [Paraburkholderia adhaesiva]
MSHDGANEALADTSSTLSSDGKILQACKDEFKSNFNLNSFKFTHTLHQSGLFEIPRIAQVARRMIDRPGSFTALNFSQGTVASKFSASPKDARLDDTIARLGESGTWVKLTCAQNYDAEYAQVLDTVTSELESLSGWPLHRDITWVSMTLLLSSPKIATPFHIDHETNFLFQLQGSKDVCLFPPNDRELLTDKEIETYYSGNFEAALYRRELQDRGTVYRLAPGEVVHNPSLAPHWVKNDDNISVSISINYCLKPLDARARVYQANYILRSMGMHPLPPGLSPMRDRVKRTVLSTLEHRNPKSFSDVIHTPINRLRSPLKAVRRLVRH